MQSMTINVHGCDGSFWPVHGEDEGAEGVVLGQGQVKGLFPVPGRTFWKSTQRQTGGTMKGLWYDPRDLLLGFHISAQRVRGGDQEDIMSRFRQALDWREDQWDHDASLAKIEVIAPSGSQRWLDIQLYEMDDFNPDVDPLVTQHANRVFPLRAGMPFYYEEPEVTTLEFTSDGAGEIEVENPTDQPMLQKWIVTRGNWTLPDVSWEGPPYQRRPGVSKQTGRDDRNRKIMLPPITALEGGATVDLDAMSLMIRDAAGTNLLGRMPVPGRFFEYCIPPKTQRQKLPVSVSNVPAGGAMVQLVQPRWWSEPIGGQ
jgi:hypothetical protein